MKNMFVYGSLKKGFFNHSLIEENPRNRFIRKGFIKGYNLYLLWSYPGVKPSSSSEDKVFVELYSLTDEVFEKIDKMEQKANYTSIKVIDDGGKEGILYIYNGKFKEKNKVIFGNWTKDHEKLKIVSENEKLRIIGEVEDES